MPATPQAVSACLKRAGFERSDSSTTSVPGWHRYTEGFKARMNYDGRTVIVTTRDDSDSRRPHDRDEEIAALRRYAEALEAAGYAVDLADDPRFSPELRVTKD